MAAKGAGVMLGYESEAKDHKIPCNNIAQTAGVKTNKLHIMICFEQTGAKVSMWKRRHAVPAGLGEHKLRLSQGHLDKVSQ